MAAYSNDHLLLRRHAGRLHRRHDIRRRLKLDLIDRRILKGRQENGRLTNVEPADRIGISAPACLQRVRALGQSGFIPGYRADALRTLRPPVSR